MIDVKEINASFMVDVFSSSAFGLKVNSMQDPNDQFRKCGLDVFGCPTMKRAIEFALLFYSPALVKLFKLKFFSRETSNFMRKTINKTINDRIESDIHRSDVIEMFIQQKKSQTENDEGDSGERTLYLFFKHYFHALIYVRCFLHFMASRIWKR